MLIICRATITAVVEMEMHALTPLTHLFHCLYSDMCMPCFLPACTSYHVSLLHSARGSQIARIVCMHICIDANAMPTFAGKFFWYFLFVFLNLLFFTSWGIIAVALTPNIQISAVLSSGVYTFWLIFGGFIVPRPQIHGWWIW